MFINEAKIPKLVFTFLFLVGLYSSSTTFSQEAKLTLFFLRYDVAIKYIN